MRKEQLSEAIDNEGDKISRIWNDLFKKQEASTKGEYVASIISNVITAVDAFLLVRKLMKSYSNVFSLLNPKKKKRG